MSKQMNQTVSFRFYKLFLNNFPFFKTSFSIKLHFRFKTFSSNSAFPKDEKIEWSSIFEFDRDIKKDVNGDLLPSLADFKILSDLNHEEIGTAQVDLREIVKSSLNHISIPLQSKILLSNLEFDVDIIGNEYFAEKPILESEKIISLPKIIEYPPKKSWSSTFIDNEDFEADVELLVNSFLLK